MGDKLAAAWRQAARRRQMDKELRGLFAKQQPAAVRQKSEAAYAQLDGNQRHALNEILIETPWLSGWW